MITITFLILGILTSLLFPPYFFYPLGFVVIPLLCYLIGHKLYKVKILKKLLYIFIYSIGFFGNLLLWIQNPFFVFEETSNIFFLSVILIILISLIFSSVFILIIYYNKILPIFYILPIIFITFEIIISIIFYGFPWITFSLIVADISFFNYFLKNFGTIITSYFVLQIFCLPYLFILNFSKIKKNIIFLIPSIVILIIVFIYNVTSNLGYDKKNISLEIFQINKPVYSVNNTKTDYYEKLLSLISNSNSEILIFAENNYPFIIKEINFTEIQSLLKKEQSVVIGGTRFENNNYYNSLFYINDSEIDYFDKKILVPFGEFLPLRNFLSIFQVISGPNDFKEGTKNRVIKINKNFNFIPIICYEIIFYWKLINDLNYESDFIINITNDIWFGRLAGPYQHFYLTKLRAAEFNKPIIRVSNNGISGILNSSGKLIKATKLNEVVSIKTELLISNDKNFYFSHKLLNYLLLFILIIIFVFNFRNINGKSKNI